MTVHSLCVFSEDIFCIESFGALSALYLFDAVVASLVCDEPAGVTEAHPTELARVRFFSSVRSFVALVRRRVTERFRTERTLERFFPGVCPNVIKHII